MTIRSKINLSYFVVFILVVSLIACAIGIYTNKKIDEYIKSYLTVSNISKAQQIRIFIEGQKKISETLAAASVYRDFLNEPQDSKNYAQIKEKIKKRFERTVAIDPEIFEVLILDKNGKTVASSDVTQEGNDESEDDYFIEGSRGTFFKDVYRMQTTVKNTYAISSPIKAEDGDLLGVSVIRYYTNHFYNIVSSENGVGKTEENYLVNKDNLFITPSVFDGEEVVLKKKASDGELSGCFGATEQVYVTQNGYKDFAKETKKQIFKTNDYRGVNVIATRAFIPETGWCIISKVDQADVYAFRNWLIVIFLAIFLIGEILFLILGQIASGKITGSLVTLRTAVRKIVDGEYGFKTGINTNDEIGDVAKSVDKLSEVISDYKQNTDRKVEEQTNKLLVNTKSLQKQKKAMLNILEDVQEQQTKARSLAAIIENTEESIVGQDLNGVILSWNRGAEKLYGYSENEVLGKNIDVIIPPNKNDEIKNIFEAIKNGKTVDHFQTIRRKKDGRLVDVSISVSPIKDSKGVLVGVSSLTIDITKEKEIDQAKSEFVSLAAHQLKTPVGALNWDMEMLLAGDYGKIGKKQKEVLEEMYGLGSRMNELINDFLNISRIDLGVFVVNPIPVSFAKIADDVLEEMEPRRVKKGHEITKQYGKDLPEIPADKTLLRIIFQNFISNAIKYTHDNGQIMVSIEKNGDSALVSVANNGNPIPLADQPHIFEKMYRASDAQEQEPDGNGLGLYLVRKIAENVGGKVWFTSKKGEDTVFYFSLPFTGMIPKKGTKVLS